MSLRQEIVIEAVLGLLILLDLVLWFSSGGSHTSGSRGDGTLLITLATSLSGTRTDRPSLRWASLDLEIHTRIVDGRKFKRSLTSVTVSRESILTVNISAPLL
jgi:hypothetical protein